jgi:glycosyltransferase involved in cell wall biosynthesis
VVPLRVGGGTRLKVLEAMSMGRAIVSTTLGAEGIPCESGKHLVLADTPSEFATTVVRLLHDRDTRSSIGNHAADWVRNHFDWTLLSMKIHAELSSLL